MGQADASLSPSSDCRVAPHPPSAQAASPTASEAGIGPGRRQTQATPVAVSPGATEKASSPFLLWNRWRVRRGLSRKGTCAQGETREERKAQRQRETCPRVLALASRSADSPGPSAPESRPPATSPWASWDEAPWNRRNQTPSSCNAVSQGRLSCSGRPGAGAFSSPDLNTAAFSTAAMCRWPR